MSSVTTFLSLLLVFCCTLFVSAHYARGETNQAVVNKVVDLFKASQQYNDLISENAQSGVSINPTDFYSPFILATKDVIIALTGANCSQNLNKISVLLLYVETKKVSHLFITNEGGSEIDWNKQIALKQVEQDNKNLNFFFLRSKKIKFTFC